MNQLAILAAAALATPAPDAPTTIPVEYNLPAPAPDFGPPETVNPAPQGHRETKRERERRNWNRVKPLAIASSLLHVADAVTTYECTRIWRNGGNCREINTGIYGHHPGIGRIIAVKAPTIIGSWLLGREISKRWPLAGYAFFGAQTIVTGKTVIQNIKIVY